ncbi:tryptophan 7-halogenase [Suttonella sp. R2A3]|nr:tryptophan 7-halogenase [Suttonella sp. R2A3]UJF23671.1 tryptophan 7-halogenase [Suttonella sp. R2A3]
MLEEAIKQGVTARFGHSVTAYHEEDDMARLHVDDPDGASYHVRARFVFDASGYGRVLARLLDLEKPSTLRPRIAIFTHIRDHINATDYDREKILISTHPEHRDRWSWLIPFADGTSSIGMVAPLDDYHAKDDHAWLRESCLEVPRLAQLLPDAEWDIGMKTQRLSQYSADVNTMYGKHFALLGNASAFLDPVFSSGLTVAMVGAQLAAQTFLRQQQGQSVDWQRDFAEPLMIGIDTFKTYVMGWYDGSFQDVIYSNPDNPTVRSMICSILAGYAWDKNNPYVDKAERRLHALAELCNNIE